VAMPRMNGYQACRLIKSEPSTERIPVVILTTRDQVGDRFWGLETGADYYVTKDAEPQRIVDLVRNILSGAKAQPTRPPSAPRTSVDVLSRVNEMLDQRLHEATVMSEMGRVARSLVHFDETFTSVMGLVARVVDFTVGAMAFVEGEEIEILMMLNRPAVPEVVDEARSRLLDAAQAGGTRLVRVQSRLFFPHGGASGAAETTVGGFVSYPIITGGRLSALMALGGRAAERIDADTRTFLGQVANQAHIVVDNSRLFDRVKNLAIRDSLTDLFNHRHSVELVAQELARVGRYASGLSLLMLDLDHFKRINDEHGHPVGDTILRDVASLLKDMLRAVDSVGRYGGEEFLVLLPHTSAEEARQTAERVRRTVERHRFLAGPQELHITVSVGVASYPAPGIDSPAALIREADQALYRAKEGGRNRVA
jgi:diguanylate cyclase (GGDEF)-like protein